MTEKRILKRTLKRTLMNRKQKEVQPDFYGQGDPLMEWTFAGYACIKTDVATLRSLLRAGDGRTKDGRIIKRLLTSAERLDEDLGVYLEEVTAS